MPGEVMPLTQDELAQLEVCPVPSTGMVSFEQSGPNQYLLDCRDVSGKDMKRLQDFFDRMKGSFHSFRYESRTHQFSCCRFGRGPVRFLYHAPNRCSVQLVINTGYR